MRPRWTLSLLPLALAIVLSGAAPDAKPASSPALTTLQPGAFRTISQPLDINIVFVGYEPGGGPRDIDLAAFDGVLPSKYRPIHRYQNFYGMRQEMGLEFTFAYNRVFADAAYEDQLFAHLSTLATPLPRTIQQNAYNEQGSKALEIVSNFSLDAPSVERWLAANPPPGVNPSNYTVFFINWYGRADFIHHVYAKTDEPDPDTNVNFGTRSSRKMIAWGGTAANDAEGGPATTARVWFYDLSAGPEFWTDNFDLETKDLDGDGVLDYRMPPVWEYGNLHADHYRKFDTLSRDLGLVTRYVAINLLFTTSPLYKPMISPPAMPGAINIDFNVYQANPASDGLALLDTAYFTQKVSPLQPLNQFTTEVNSQAFASRAAAIYTCFFADVSCYGGRLFNIAFGDLFLYHDDHLTQFIEGDDDYELPVFLFNGTASLNAGGLLGFADDNWRDGTQTYVFGFVSPLLISAGYGFTFTSIHEVGHHLGMSHPHDGYDSARRLDYGATGPFYFANSGDESNTVMSYIDLNTDFGQFDRDNMARYLTAGYINQANAILPLVLAAPQAASASGMLAAADANAAAALTAFGAMDYATAAATAKAAYTGVLAAATAAGVHIESQHYTADYKAKGRSPKFVDAVDYRRLAP